MEFSFKDVNDDEIPQNWLKNAFQELLDYITRGFQPTSMIGVVIENEEFPDKPAGISFRRLSQLSADVVMDIISAIIQSNASFFANDKMTIRIDVIDMPLGRGFSALDGKCVNFKEFCIAKNSIFVVDVNNFCLAASLIVAIEYTANGCNRKVLQKFKTKKGKIDLLNLAQALCQRVNVDITHGGGHAEIQRFQNYFKEDYIIVVYNKRDGTSVYFKGDYNINKPRINLLLEDQHYNVILSLTGAFATRFFCEYCLTKYSQQERHKNCPFKCPCCLTSPPCNDDPNVISCNMCNRVFKGEICLNKHKKAKTCDRIKRCSTCHAEITPKNKKKSTHKCGKKFCNTCKEDKDIRHDCYMHPCKVTRNNNEAHFGRNNNFLFIFFDFETRQEKKIGEKLFLHEPNLCVTQQICKKCLSNDDMSENCGVCGQRQYIFNNEPVSQLMEHIAKMSKIFAVTAIAHNMKNFDGAFILQHIFSNISRWQPKVIKQGMKILSITCGGSIRFIDSLNFIQLPLASFPKTFKLEGGKGYFPHYFNTLENQNYTGDIPSVEYYGCDVMKKNERRDFMDWHRRQVADNYVFTMKNEIIKYCVSDVDILRRGCLKFRECFTESCNVDPLLECITIASSCNLVFRRNFLKPNTIGIIPTGGYRGRDRHSKIAIAWLLWQEYTLQCRIKHAGNGPEVRLRENIVVDGFCSETNTVFEFSGCFWHGCPRCFPDFDSELADRNELMVTRYERTIFKNERIKNNGYNLNVIWECDFRKQITENRELKQFVDNHLFSKNTPLNPRDSFYGGRTNASQLYYKCQPGERILYFDVCSLYPYVNKYGRYPVGHPTAIHVGHPECVKVDLNKVHGFIKCIVLPPVSLYHPVLPYKCNGKLTFPLCKTCVETLYEQDCPHNDGQRQFTGTFVADELRKALELKYRIIEIFEIWEYDTVKYDPETKTGGLFSEYVNTFLKIKQECSGWPTWCNTEHEKDNYIREYYDREGVKLEKNKICKNPGLRFLAKLMLNSFWGKFGQRQNLQQTAIIDQPYKLFEMFASPGRCVNNLTVINPEVLLVNWERVEEDILASSTTNVAIASYTTASARLVLYHFLEKLGRRVLYYDTDSVFFTAKPDEWVPDTGDFLGQLTDELADYGPGSYITEFVSGGPKNYAYEFLNANKGIIEPVCKVKGITLHYSNNQKVNFNVLKSMILDKEAPNVVEVIDKQIFKDKFFNILTKDATKNYLRNDVFTKNCEINIVFHSYTFFFAAVRAPRRPRPDRARARRPRPARARTRARAPPSAPAPAVRAPPAPAPAPAPRRPRPARARAPPPHGLREARRGGRAAGGGAQARAGRGRRGAGAGAGAGGARTAGAGAVGARTAGGADGGEKKSV
ncbi:uncharacterized protein LOC135129984 [Zophobas morio]|uniref:uncharacterized protein LOC135129984 n=1 Tax=Zophobas morio TaxID=2755281 RepID=UPI003083D8AD